MDEKGRVMVPLPFREVLVNTYRCGRLYIATAPFDPCLDIYPLKEWEEFEKKVRSYPTADRRARRYQRKVVASAMEVELDRQGRVLIPQAHREELGLKGEVVLVGQVNKIELWSKEAWVAEMQAIAEDETLEEEILKYEREALKHEA
jgi:MraZ protein